MHAVHSVPDDISWGAGVFPAVAPVPDEDALVSGFCRNPVLDNASRDTVLEQARQIVAVARDAVGYFVGDDLIRTLLASGSPTRTTDCLCVAWHHWG